MVRHAEGGAEVGSAVGACGPEGTLQRAATFCVARVLLQARLVVVPGNDTQVTGERLSNITVAGAKLIIYTQLEECFLCGDYGADNMAVTGDWHQTLVTGCQTLRWQAQN